MADATSDFFDRLAQPAARPPLGNVTATIRIDLDRGKATEHWLLTVDKGAISVSSKNATADAALHQGTTVRIECNLQNIRRFTKVSFDRHGRNT